MEVVVINLPEERARRERIEARLAALGLEARFLAATDGRHLSPAERDIVDERERRRHTAHPMSDAAIACLLSHLRVLRALAEHGPSRIAVLEDDVALAAELPAALAALEALPEEVELVKLARWTSRPLARCRELAAPFSLGVVRYHEIGAQGYCVSRLGARRLLAAHPRFAFEIDIAISHWWVHGLRVYSLDPPVLFHDDRGHSTIRAREPAAAPLYPGARTPLARLGRRANRLRWSVLKRVRFRGYLRGCREAALAP